MLGGRTGLIAIGLLLAGCTTNTAQFTCPSPQVFGPVGEVTKFVPGPGRDLTDVVLEAGITVFGGFCDADLERDGSGSILIELTLLIEASRGPANDEGGGQLVYFVALTDAALDEVIEKSTFDAPITFPRNAGRVSLNEVVELEIPVQPGVSGADFGVLVGFQLTDEEIQYNLNKRG